MERRVKTPQQDVQGHDSTKGGVFTLVFLVQAQGAGSAELPVRNTSHTDLEATIP